MGGQAEAMMKRSHARQTNQREELQLSMIRAGDMQLSSRSVGAQQLKNEAAPVTLQMWLGVLYDPRGCLFANTTTIITTIIIIFIVVIILPLFSFQLQERRGDGEHWCGS